MPPSFNRGDHNLRTLRTATGAGLVFGTFDHAAPALEDYLGPEICARMDRVLPKPVRVLGYNTQVLRNNWKGSVAKSGYLVTCLCDLPRRVEA